MLGSGLRPPAAEVRTIDAAYSSHRHSTDREQVRIQSETSGSPCGLCVMQFDVPNLHNSYLKLSIQAAVRLVPPLPAGYRYLGRYVCGLCVLRGYGTTTRHANRARVRRRERHDRTTHDSLHELQHNSYHAGAQACLCVTCLRVWQADGARRTRARRGCATDKAEPVVSGGFPRGRAVGERRVTHPMQRTHESVLFCVNSLSRHVPWSGIVLLVSLLSVSRFVRSPRVRCP